LKTLNFERTTPLNTITSNTYKNTARADVLNFVQSLAPTPAELPYLASVFAKNSLSMKDFKTLCHFIASRAVENRINPDSIDALGLSSLPNAVRQEVAQ
jgi:hypothetical protein